MIRDGILRREKIIVIAILLLCGGAELFLWHKTAGFPSALDQAEPFLSYLSAGNFDRLGVWNLRFLEEYATSSSVEAHPYFYTHNGNFPTFISLILLKLGISSLPVQNLLIIPVFLLGLWYLYAAIRSWVNPLAGLAVLTIVATNYLGSLAFGFNLYRAWAWLLIWATLYHFKTSQERTGQLKKIHLRIAGIFLFLTVYYEYSLALFLVMIIIAAKALGSYKISWMEVFKFIVLYALSSFLLHLFLVAWALGWPVALKDLVFTLTNRAFGYPPREALQRFYDTHGIVLWGYPSFNPFSRSTFLLWKDQLRQIEMIFGKGIMLLVSGWVTIGIWQWIKFHRTRELREIRLVLSLALATFIVFLLMPAHFYYLYLVSMPFTIFFIDTVRGITLVKLGEFAGRRIKAGLRVLLSLIFVGYFIWIVYAQYNNARNFTPQPFPASDVLHKYRGYSFITNYQPAYVHYFTREWAYIVGWYAGPISEPFKSPYIFEGDKLNNPSKYAYPDFLLWINVYGIPFPRHLLNKYPLIEQGEDFAIIDLRSRERQHYQE